MVTEAPLIGISPASCTPLPFESNHTRLPTSTGARSHSASMSPTPLVLPNDPAPVLNNVMALVTVPVVLFIQRAPPSKYVPLGSVMVATTSFAPGTWTSPPLATLRCGPATGSTPSSK